MDGGDGSTLWIHLIPLNTAHLKTVKIVKFVFMCTLPQ